MDENNAIQPNDPTQPTALYDQPETAFTPPFVEPSTPTQARPQAPTAQPTQQPVQQGFEPHNIWGAVFKALGGGDRTEYRVAGPNETDAQGKPIPEGTTVGTKVAPTKGQLGKAILASVLYGLAAGEKERGPGAGLRSFAAGAGATMDMHQTQDDKARAAAQTDFANQQTATLRKAQTFATNAEAVHNIRLAEQIQGETFDGMVARDSAALAEVPESDIVDRDVPQDQALANMKAGKYGATTHNVYVTGSTEVHDKYGNVVKDPLTGQPKKEATVTITNDNKVPLSKEDAARYAALGIPGFKGLNPNTDQTVLASQKRGWDQIAHSVENARGMARKAGVTDEEFNTALQQPGAAKALQQFSRYSTGDPYADLKKMEEAKDKQSGSPVYGARTMSILNDAFGGDKALQYHNKLEAQKKAGDVAAEESVKPMNDDRAASILSDPKATPTQKTQAATFQKIKQQQKAREKAAEVAADNAIKQGSPDAAGKLMYEGTLTLSELKARSSTPQFIIQATQAAQRYAQAAGEKNWTPQTAEAKFNAAKSPGNVQFFGSANSLVDQGGTLDQLKSQYGKLGNGSIPLFNKWKDYVEYEAGDPAMAGFMQTAIGVADDYAKVMGGGTGSDTSRLQVMKSFANAHNPQQMQAAIDAARNAVNSQIRSRIGTNRVMQQIYGYALPQPVEAPPANLLKEGVHTTFKNGQTWTLQNGQPVQIQAQ